MKLFLSLPREMRDKIFSELDGRSLISLAKAVSYSDPAVTDGIAAEVRHRECSVETAVAKAKMR